MSKVSPVNIITDYVKSRALPVTRQEIIKGTMLSKDQVRKATNDLTNKGRLATEIDEMGVTRYMTPEANMKQIAEMPFTLDEVCGAKEVVDMVAASVYKTKTVDVWSHHVVEAEERGFAKGYALGVQEAQRAAFYDGKRSVLTKLEALLS